MSKTNTLLRAIIASAGLSIVGCNSATTTLDNGFSFNSSQLSQWSTAAKNGDANAQFLMGFASEDTPATAAYWYAFAADQGHAPSMNNLGEMYYEGKGVEKNTEKAEYYYARAAAQGFAPAQYNLGVMLMFDTETSVDDKAGFQMITMAANNGHTMSKYLVTSFAKGTASTAGFAPVKVKKFTKSTTNASFISKKMPLQAFSTKTAPGTYPTTQLTTVDVNAN